MGFWNMCGFIPVLLLYDVQTKCIITRSLDVCGSTGDMYNCQHQQLKFVPGNITSNITAIDLSDNDIVNLQDDDFNGMYNLKAIYLNRNRIKHIKKNVFQHLPNLCILDLSSNQLRKGSIEKGTFQNMNSIQDLKINDNPFPNGGFPDEEIERLSSLRNLSMSTTTSTLHFSSKFRSLKTLKKLEIDSHVDFQLNNKSFENLAELKIEYVHFVFSDYCPCRNIDEDLFWAFANLKGLHFQTSCGMRYALKSLMRLQSKTLNYLNFSSSFALSAEVCMVLNENEVKYLRNVCAKTVSLKETGIVSIDAMKSSLFMKCIEQIDLSFNLLRNTPFAYAILEAPRIKVINVSHQSSRGSYSSPSKNRKPMFQQMPFNLTLSPSLEILDMSNTMIDANTTKLKFEMYGANLQRLNLRYISFSFCTKSNFELFFPRLWFLDVSGVQCNDLYVAFLKDFHPLSELYMSDVNLDVGLTRDVKGEFLNGLTNLKVVDFSENALKDLHPNIFQSQSLSLETLKLNDNLLTTVPDALRVATSLRILEMRSNKIVSFSTEDIITLNHLKGVQIDVRGNPFDCFCNAIDSLRRMSDHQELFLHLNETYCIEEPTKTLLTVINDMRSIELQCMSMRWLEISTSALSFTFLFLATFTILYRYRILVRYGMLRIRLFWRKSFSAIITCNIPAYDAYISYSSIDFVWVRTKLYPALTEENLQIALQDKDFDPGSPYAEEIVKFINMSKYVIFVITRQFIKSEWGSYEIQVAKIHAIHTNAKLVLIIKDGIQIEDLPKDFLFIWWKIKPLVFNENETERKQAKFFKRLITTIKD
ncbi:toll-like receptor 2 [Ostrea edulis]|uniref:toll-like receptor 2 n=1 Tax=Ostrea edulis TaxID=37623 RepID=UPI0024AFD839|nr:toll-like receptor 2 [Ostrea edulis]